MGEALNLMVADLIREPLLRAQITGCTFRRTKNGEDRSIPLSPRAALLACNWDSTSQSAFQHAFRAVAPAGITPHTLRHSYVTRALAAGVPLAVVAALVGHRSYRTTARYAHLSAKDCLTQLQKHGMM